MTQSGDNTSAYLVLAVTIETMGAHVMQHTVNPFSANSFFGCCVAVGIVRSIGIAFALVVTFAFALVVVFVLVFILAVGFCVRGFICLGFGSLFHPTLHFVRIANAADNLLHGVDVDGSHAILLQAPQMFCHTMFNVVEYLVASVAFGKIAAHVVEIVLKKCAGVLVDGIERTEEVYVDVFLHNFIQFFFGYSFGLMFFKMFTVWAISCQALSCSLSVASPSGVRE